MAAQSQNWGHRELSLRCFVACDVILDEYLKDPTAALQALDEAKQLFGVILHPTGQIPTGCLGWAQFFVTNFNLSGLPPRLALLVGRSPPK